VQEAPPKASFWSELTRRHVVKVAVAYAVVGIAVGEGAQMFLPSTGAPAWVSPVILVLIVLGFPVALVLAWAYDMTPEGVVRTGASSQAAATSGFAGSGGTTLAAEPPAPSEPRSQASAHDPSGSEVRDQASPSIAVLPFDDMSPDGDQEYFGDGMAEELINALTRLPGLRVAARTSSFAHKGRHEHIREIGKDLEVATILEGSVRKSGTRLRLTAQLIQVDGGHHLWSEVYEREMEDVFAIQDEITRAVVDALRVELLGEPDAPLVTAPTDNLEAYELYLKGRHYWDRRYEYGLQTAIQYFEEASQKDPDFALPYTGIADTHVVLGLYNFVPPLDARERAGAAIEKATGLGPELPEVLYSQALLGMLFDGSLDESERILARVLDLDPNHGVARGWRGIALIAQGHWEAGLNEAREAAEREPHSGYIQGLVGLEFLWARNSAGGIPFAERALELEPDGVLGLYVLGFLYDTVGRHDEAVDLMARVVEKTDRHHTFLAWYTSVLASAGRVEESESILKEVLAMYDPSQPRGVAGSLGGIYAGLGDADNAVSWMNKGLEEGYAARMHITFPQYDPIRGHPGFARIVENVGLPALWADPTLGK